LDIFNVEGLKVDLIDMDMLKSEDMVDTKAGGTDTRLEELKNILVDKGVVAKTLTFDGAPNENVADIFREYGVVVASMMRSPRKNNPLLGLLGRIASPVLICWR
jgi:hypothetical protein